MKHEMKLQEDPFEKIKYGIKTIEMRLYDEKRSKVKVGDTIVFNKMNADEVISAEVTNLYHYKNFEELYENHDKFSLGYKKDEKADFNDMSKYYSDSDINKYGVLAIEIKLVRSKKDIDISNEYGTFKLRSVAVIIDEDKILLEKTKKYDGYCFPGGHVEIGELSKDAMLREAKEELKVEFEIKKLLCVHENLYSLKNGKVANEIAYYYVLDPKGDLPKEDFVIKEYDKGILKEHKYCWIKIKELNLVNLNPTDVAALITKEKESENIIITSN